MHRRTFVTTAASSITTLIAGCAETESDSASGGSGSEPADGAATDSPEETPTPTESTEPAVKLLDHTLTWDDQMGSAAVTGTVTNTTDGELAYMQVEVKFFDSDDTRVGEGMWNATEVSAGRTVQFKTTPAMVDAKPASYEVETATSP